MVATGDDFGTSTSTYWSPRDFRDLIKPFHADLIGTIKSRFPHIKFYLHSPGQIMDIGDAPCFHAGIDIKPIVPLGPVDEVRDHVRRVIDVLAPGVGTGRSCRRSARCPAENVIGAYELADEYGRQPIGGQPLTAAGREDTSSRPAA